MTPEGKDTFVEVGTALAEIRDAKLYRPKQTFEEYCKDRWNFSKRSAYQFIAAARQAPAEQQPAAWERAQETAKEESKPVAARSPRPPRPPRPHDEPMRPWAHRSR